MASKLTDNKVIVEDKRTRDRLIQKGFGERIEKELVLDLKEALYLAEKKKLEVKDKKGKKLSAKKLLALGEEAEEKFYTKYIVFRDLRDRGYVTKTGFKFGFHFRVYPRGKKAGEEHTYWVVSVCTQDEILGMDALSRMVRLAGNLNTILLFAIVDAENDINYYEVKRVTP